MNKKHKLKKMLLKEQLYQELDEIDKQIYETKRVRELIKKRKQINKKLDRLESEEEKQKSWSPIIIIIMIIIFAYILGIFCYYNPDCHCQVISEENCVCKEWECEPTKPNVFGLEEYIYDDSNPCIVGYSKVCIKQRKKTEQEKEIEYCNKNPDDSERCICEEKRKEIFKCLDNATIRVTVLNKNISFTYFVANNNKYTCLPITDTNKYPLWIDYPLREYSQTTEELNYHNKTFEYSCIKAIPKPKPIKINLEEEKCVEHTNETTEWGKEYFLCKNIYDNCRLGNFESSCIVYNQYCCLKKEKLTECEKNNPNFIEEMETYCNEIRESVKMGVLSIDFCNQTIHKTICREKTEEEKLSPVEKCHQRGYDGAELPYRGYCFKEYDDCTIFFDEKDKPHKPSEIYQSTKSKDCKTEIEKLMDKNCDWLFSKIVNCYSKLKLKILDCKEERQELIKTAFKEKECEI